MLKFLCISFVALLVSAVSVADDGKKPWFSKEKTSENGAFQITFEAVSGTAQLNEYHDWVLIVRDAKSRDPITPLRVIVGGGMPHHGHGLPSQPQIGKHLGAGYYEVKGVKFNMNGVWTLSFELESKAVSDKVSFQVKIDY